MLSKEEFKKEVGYAVFDSDNELHGFIKSCIMFYVLQAFNDNPESSVPLRELYNSTVRKFMASLENALKLERKPSHD